MMWTNTKRILRSGFVSFFRNKFVSIATIFMMAITLFAVGSLLFSSALLNDSLEELKEKVDINVYFVTTASEADILSIMNGIESLPEVKKVIYTSKEEAVVIFRERHADDQRILQALEELDDNPLGAILSIKAKEPSQYEGIANYLETDTALSVGGVSIVDKVNYAQNKIAIERLTAIIETSEQSNLLKTILLVVISVLITFNTIQLAIYNSREEIRVMKLVGAGNMYVQGPFLVVGVMYGVFSAAIALILFYPVTEWGGPMFYPFNFVLVQDNIDLFARYSSDFTGIFFIVLTTGIFLGVVSSYLAVKKYINV